jgi:hypothetical protein
MSTDLDEPQPSVFGRLTAEASLEVAKAEDVMKEQSDG